MRDELKMRDNESSKEFGIRLYSNKIEYGLSNKEIYDIYVKETGDSRAESSIRGYFTNIIDGINIGYEKALSDREDNDLIRELEEKRIELEKEKVRFQDQRREYKKYLRQDARFEHLKDIIKREINNVAKEKELIVPYCRQVHGDREAILILSDWHIGATNDNHWNKFNLDIAKQRVGKLLEKTIAHCRRNSVNTIHIELLGDLVNGYLHIGNRIENEEDIISQIMTASEILSEFATELSAHIPNVKIYSATGNHGRCSPNLKESIEIENFERMIPWYMKSRLKNNERIEFIENEVDSNIIIMRFLNETIYACHGHMDKPNSAISNLSRMLKEFPTEAHFGHYHSYKEFDEYDMTTTVNGTLSGVDEYAKRIRKTGSPMQVLMIYNEEGRECTYKIKL